MAPQSQSEILKGYIKTENMLLIIAVALAIGFVGGVVFSAYRASRNPMVAQPGTSASLSGEDQELKKNLIERTQANPKDVEAWTHLGHFYFDNDQPAEAIEAYQTALALEPQRPDVWVDMGVMYRRSGKPEKAIEAFDRALEINPEHHIGLFNKGVVLMHDLNNSQGALQSWEKLVSINPEAKTPSGQSVKELVEELKKKSAS